MKYFFEELFIYNHLVNEKMINCLLASQDKVESRGLDLISHVVQVHDSWNKRMLNMDGPKALWDRLVDKELLAGNKANFTKSVEIIKMHSLETNFEYRNSKGVAFHNSFRDVLFHIINHSSYHRGQINAVLRTAGIEPVITEYIYYKR